MYAWSWSARKAFEAIPARFAGYGAYRTCKAQADALERFCAGRVPGLRATYWDSSFRQPCGTERVEQIDWDGARAGKTQFFGCRYHGFLLVPENGEYEIALASEQAAKLSLDARQVIDHGKAHNMTERSVKLTLTAGRTQSDRSPLGLGMPLRQPVNGCRKMLERKIH